MVRGMTLAFAFALVVGLVGARAEDDKKDKKDKAFDDATFVKMAASSGMEEVEVSKIAVDKAKNAEVKRFAERMLRDHGKTTGELKGMLGQLQGVSAQQMPTGLDQQHQALLQQLQGAQQGAEFDRVFAQQQLQSHQAAVELFRAYAQSGDDARLKQWASQTLPSLEEHLREAQQLLQPATRG